MKRTIYPLTLIVILLSTFNSFSQYYPALNIPIFEDGALKVNGLTGGMNVPQFSEVDLNDDGLMDLYYFDRVGNAHVTFLQIDEGNGPFYKYDYEYSLNFPTAFHWVALRDYDGDGIHDLFSSSQKQESIQGTLVYKGKYVDGKIDFDRVPFFTNFGVNILTAPILGSNLHTNIYTSQEDYPAFDDIDGDGDMDVLTFASSGTTVEYFRNTSIEDGFGMDSLRFEIGDLCWGGFIESGLSSDITLSEIQGECASGMPQGTIVEERHAGSTLLTFDEDADGDKEIVIGDVSTEDLRLHRLINGGDFQEAWMIEEDAMYPSYNVTAVMNFPASFYVDVNFDGTKDLLVSPNISNSSTTPNVNVAWFYENLGQNNNPNFNFQQENFLVETMIDMGTNTFPSIADINGDGLLDIVVGNSTFYLEDGSGGRDAYLRLYENTGTADQPAFTLVDEDWLSFNQYSSVSWRFAPTFGDIDDDGDLDLLVGDNNGKLFFAENTAGPGNPMQFPVVTPQWKDIDVGVNATPNIYDLNFDDKADLIIGERSGNVNFLENIGSATNPDFNPDEGSEPNIDKLGKIDAVLPNEVTGYTAPRILRFGNSYKIFVGTEFGDIWQYDINTSDLSAQFPLVDSLVGKVDPGRESAPAFADLNNDGFFEMVLGNQRGGLQIFQTDLEVVPVNTIDKKPSLVFQVSPNPAKDLLNLTFRDYSSQTLQCNLFNSVGIQINEETIHLNNQTSTLDVSKLPTGVYLLKIRSGEKWGIQKFIKK